MSSKTILLGLRLFQSGSETSVYGCPSWAIAPYDLASKTTQDFSSWSIPNMLQQNAHFMSVQESAIKMYKAQFCLRDIKKSIIIRIGSQTAWELVKNDYIDNREITLPRNYELHGKCAALF